MTNQEGQEFVSKLKLTLVKGQRKKLGSRLEFAEGIFFSSKRQKGRAKGRSINVIFFVETHGHDLVEYLFMYKDSNNCSQYVEKQMKI